MSKIDTDPKKVEEILSRSIAEILPTKNALQKMLHSGKKLRIYIGTDATGTSLHLGHATNYMILEKLRRLGHEIILLIGDFTARIGDPTDKSDSVRKQLTREEVIRNTKTWIDQIHPIIDIYNRNNPVRILYNHDWLAKLTFENIIDIASNFTVQQMIERDMFEKRIESGSPLYLHELFYPLMQGYDSVAMDIDIEVCGMDQKFNALIGRSLMRKIKKKDKFVLITTLLVNPATGEKMMSKSLGTGIFLDFDAEKMYGALMAQIDENMRQLFVDCTWLDMEEIDHILDTKNPRDAKMLLAFEITKIYHGEESAKKAEDIFVQMFQNKELPKNIPEFRVKKGSTIVDVLFESGFAKSKSDARRILIQGGIKINGKKILGTDVDKVLKLLSRQKILQKGKRYFLRLV